MFNCFLLLNYHSVDGRYLSSDDNFLEHRRRGLQRFLNLLLKHPLLKNEKLVGIFLSVDTELSVWRSSGSQLDFHEEYMNRIIAQDFVNSWDEAVASQLWRDVQHSAEAALETLTQLCILTDRMSKRKLAMASDMSKVASVFNAFNQTMPLLYQSRNKDTETAGDLPAIRESLNNVAGYVNKSSNIFRDEGSALDIRLLEDVKILRDTVSSVLEMFRRFEKLGGDTIPQLERRIKMNETKLQQNTHSGPGISVSERDRLVKSIESDKNTIQFQKNRSWLIRQTITEELELYQRTQYLVAKVLRNWATDGVKYSEMQADNWASLSRDIVLEFPLS